MGNQTGIRYVVDRLYRTKLAIALLAGFAATACVVGFDDSGTDTEVLEGRCNPAKPCPVAPPSNTQVPTISGTAVVGATLTSSTGTWTGTPLSYAYQWRRCDVAGNGCASISGATSTSYVLTSSDQGSTLRVVVTASNAAGSATATSAATAVVAGASSGGSGYRATVLADAPIGYWRLGEASGTTANDSAGSNAGTYVNGVLLGQAGALADGDTAARFDGVDDHVSIPHTPAQQLNDGFSIEYWAKAVSFVNVSPRILAKDSGAVGRGYIVYYGSDFRPYFQRNGFNYGATGSSAPMSTAEWKHYVMTYDGSQVRWYVNGQLDTGSPMAASLPDISITTALQLGGVDTRYGNHYLDDVAIYTTTLTATRVAAHYSARTQSGTGTAVAPSNTAVPTISGTPTVGSTLTATTGTWTGTAPISYAHQWRRCDSAGNGCVSISGATAASYAVTSTDQGSTLRVAVTASNSAGSATATSAQTAVVQSAPAAGNVYNVPTSIDRTGATDVSAALTSWINANVPNGTASNPSIVRFPTNSTYRIQTTLRFDNRSNLIFDGQDRTVTFNWTTPLTFNSGVNPSTGKSGYWEGNDALRLWDFRNCQNITLRYMNLHGPSTFPSSGDGHVPWYNVQHMHAVHPYQTANLVMDHLTIDNFPGDGVDFTNGGGVGAPLSSGKVLDCDIRRINRNGVSIVGGSGIEVRRTYFGEIGYWGVDSEPNNTYQPANNVLVDSCTFGTQSGATTRAAMGIVANGGAVNDNTFSNNVAVGRPMLIWINPFQDWSVRPQRVKIIGNSSNTSSAGAAVVVRQTDTVDISGNSIAVSSGSVVQLDKSCNVAISGSTYTIASACATGPTLR